MHCSSEIELQMEKMLILCYLLTFTFKKIGKNNLCFFVLGETKAIELLSAVYIGHSHAERQNSGAAFPSFLSRAMISQIC